jgi:transcriptional antiterminator RfaH
MKRETEAMSFWAVAQTVTNRESFVAERIEESGFEIFMPKTRMRINGDMRVIALFPGYLFVRIIDRWRAAAKTMGVLGLIMSGEQPACCPDEEVDKIKSQIYGGLVRLPKPEPKCEPFAIGQPVRIVSGSFRGFEAIYDGMGAHERECVLLEILGRMSRVELAVGDMLVDLVMQPQMGY